MSMPNKKAANGYYFSNSICHGKNIEKILDF